ncbi:MAG: rhamnogalacturonan acetylesterase [Candidatus Hydrogenedentes bacterium]|nr:rhamnogalacturonan acetylesterase [Candidatus Hydrogenedentota bacterium]
MAIYDVPQLSLNRLVLVVTASLSFASFAGIADAPCRLYVIGDSTAAAYPEDRRPLAGWAEALQEHFDPARVVIEDKARSGRSSKSFLEEGAWAPIRDALKPGDYVFIQFGHNDSKKEDPKRYTEPDSTYRQFLTTYVNDARAKGAIPVLLTSINRNHWDENKALVDTMGAYPDAVRALAKDLDVPLIDLHQRTHDLFQSLGPDATRGLFLYLAKGESPNYPDGKEDGTHLCEEGARAVSKLVVDTIKEMSLPLADAIKK